MPAEKISTTVLKDGDVEHVNTLRIQWGKPEGDQPGYVMLEIRNHDEPDITRLVNLEPGDIERLITVLRRIERHGQPERCACCTRPGVSRFPGHEGKSLLRCEKHWNDPVRGEPWVEEEGVVLNAVSPDLRLDPYTRKPGCYLAGCEKDGTYGRTDFLWTWPGGERETLFRKAAYCSPEHQEAHEAEWSHSRILKHRYRALV